MNRSRLVIGVLGVAAMATSLLLLNTFGTEAESKYSKNRGTLGQTQSSNHYQDWLEAKMLDVETGLPITPDRLQDILHAHALQPKSLVVEWMEHGPDNIGGRTRAVHIDRLNNNRIWSGGVTGGLYKSENRANRWYRVDNFPGNQMISSISQDAAGNVYVATGSLQEGSSWTGNGLYVTPDAGETWELVPGTENMTRINRVIGHENWNHIYFTTNSGFPLRKYSYGGEIENVSSYGGQGARTLAVSDDGEIIVCGAGNHRTFVSKDAGETWEDKSGNGEGQIATGGVARIEYAVSTKKSNGHYSIYATTVNGGASNNQGQWISINTGDNWHQHTPATGPGIENGVIDFRNQGTWNNVATFDPTDPKRVIVGGIDLHEWRQVIDNPPSGGWNKISLWFVNPTNPLYVHADNHDLKWDKNNVLYIGNDGGVNKSEDLAQTFYPANRGYNIAQFFKIAYDREGAVVGGTQDNGSLYNNYTNSTFREFRQVTGGDGFSAAISFFNPNLIITSSQFNNLNRSGDGGQTFNPLVPRWPAQYADPGTDGAQHPFHTEFYLAEYYDPSSEDSVLFVPQQRYDAGDVVRVPSLATGDTIDYITPTIVRYSDTLLYDPSLTRTEYVVIDEHSGISYDLGIFDFEPMPSASGNYPPAIGDSLIVNGPLGLDTIKVASFEGYDFFVGVEEVSGDLFDMARDTMLLGIPWDTLKVMDPFQSWFVVATTANGGELWGTRDALRLSILEPKWARIATQLGGAALDVEFSEDLNHMFVSGGPFKSSTEFNNSGPLHRIDGLGSVYSSDPDFMTKVDTRDQFGATATTKTQISNLNFAGIGIDPRNPDILVATQGFNGSVYRSNNATSATPTFTNVGSQGGLAFYDVVVDRDDHDILFAATINGVSLSEDGGATWTDVSDPSFAGTPCYHIEQSWRTWDEGNKRPGAIFLGTHGRGIFSTDAVLNVAENDNVIKEKEKKESFVSVYPNPSRDNSTLVIDVKKESSNVSILFFNLSGSVVKSINRTNMYMGKNEIFFSASDLPQGTYLIRVQAGDQIETTKYIKM